MELKYNKLNKILEAFYEQPTQKFTIRDIAKITKIPVATVQIYLQELKKQQIITKNNEAETNLKFKIKKINYFIEKITNSGLLEYFIKTYHPSCIILFGSIRKGDSTHESDIDLFIETSIKPQILPEQFEKILKHKIQLFIEQDIHKLQPQLLNNIINGIKLFGSFTIK